eukprot:TRINITY_DN25473_c0_g1_i1.p1 TRINITY_DN25473_c0_g1~~TRINITY_DN25473_c0_g1_i1.p1  ORF type:complete len:547 (+),score=141.40 TRINITY_DN25473_c0_g1_i1:87-1643(+)
MAKAIGLQPLSQAVRVAASFEGEARVSHGLTKAVAALLPLAQRYLLHRHKEGISSVDQSALSKRISALRIREVDKPLRLDCSLQHGSDDSKEVHEVDCYLDFKFEGNEAPLLLAVPGVSLPAACVELSRLLVPPGPRAEAVPRRHAREALTTFLASVATAGEAGASALCTALGVGPLLDGNAPWPAPDEVAKQLAAEARLLASEAEHSQEADTEQPAAKKPCTAADSKGNAEANDEQGDVEAHDKPRHGETAQGGQEEAGLLQAWFNSNNDQVAEPPQKRQKILDSEQDADASQKGDSLSECGAKGEHQDDGKGKGKGKDKSKRAHDRDAAELGDVFKELPSRPESSGADKANDGEKSAKAFKTRVYDLEDLRGEVKKMALPPMQSGNDMPKEERQQVGYWGEKFVYTYLRKKLEAEDGGKRVVWVNEVEETGFQYDLRIEDSSSGSIEAYVEVKTSRSRDKQFFEMSYKEWVFAQKEGNRYVIFRVSNAGRDDVELCSIANPFRQWKDLNLGMCLSL